MRLSFLVDNNTLIDRYFLGEPGLSILVETADARILFDTGYSDAFIRNAAALGLDLLHLDRLVLSHGHLDHTWGLSPLIRLFTEAAIEGRPLNKPVLSAHPAALEPRSLPRLGEIGGLMDARTLSAHFPLDLSPEPRKLAERVWLLGRIPRRLGFEESPPMGVRHTEAGPVPDDLIDDTALVLDTPKGLVVVTGCAHAGVCNTVEHARDVVGKRKVRGVLGGMHLLDAPAERLNPTTDYLAGLGLDLLAPCHCTDLAAKLALSRAAPLTEAGAGLQLLLE